MSHAAWMGLAGLLVLGCSDAGPRGPDDPEWTFTEAEFRSMGVTLRTQAPSYPVSASSVGLELVNPATSRVTVTFNLCGARLRGIHGSSHQRTDACPAIGYSLRPGDTHAYDWALPSQLQPGTYSFVTEVATPSGQRFDVTSEPFELTP